MCYCSLFSAVISSLPDVVVVDISSGLHLTANQVARVGKGFRGVTSAYPKKLALRR